MAGSQLGDILAGFGGHPVNRPGLEAFVANSQAMNGLRSAQTEEAMLKAEQASQQQAALSRLHDALVANGTPDAEASLVSQLIQANAGAQFKDVQGGLGDQLLNHFRQTMGNPSKLNTPDQTAAAQGISGKLEGPTALPGSYSVPVGVNAPVEHQTQLSAAQTASAQALAGLNTDRVANPQKYRNIPLPMTDAQMDDQAAAMAEGRLAVPTWQAMARNPQLAEVFSRAIHNNPLLSQTDEPTAQTTEKAFTTGVQGKNIAAINTAVQHLGTVRQLIQAWQAAGGDASNPILQRVYNFIGTQTNSSAPTNIQTAMQLLSPEITKSTLQSGAGAQEEREGAQKMVSSLDASQALDALGTYEKLLAGRSVALKNEYQTGGGKKVFENFLLPDTRQALGLTLDPVPVTKPQTPAANLTAPPAPAPGAGLVAPQGVPGAVGSDNPLAARAGGGVPPTPVDNAADNAPAIPAGTPQPGAPPGAPPAGAAPIPVGRVSQSGKPMVQVNGVWMYQ